ncbi:hypothetical protein [Paraliomyxa miuraensis]|uniref:hypothetical protein n=1 Tax=Paraliomyxa miuraensis TaxID=376150 RepID=UPI00225B4A06|nr:hypothetical protein [Paraliomyxa miuraensis]MCX4245472.1 hypothetical protein [Paraliomyxa miuraensis]
MSGCIVVRTKIEDTLGLIADREAQLRYQAEVPCVDVSTELFLQWEDWYRPDTEDFQGAFDPEEAATLRMFHQVFAVVRDTMIQGLPPIDQFVTTTAWKRLSGAACSALGLLRRSLQAA